MGIYNSHGRYTQITIFEKETSDSVDDRASVSCPQRRRRSSMPLHSANALRTNICPQLEWMNGFFRRSLALGRDQGGLEQRDRKLLRSSSENFCGRDRGGKLSGTRLRSSIFANGGLVFAISHTVAPSDQTSTLRALYAPRRISGACQ